MYWIFSFSGCVVLYGDACRLCMFMHYVCIHSYALDRILLPSRTPGSLSADFFGKNTQGHKCVSLHTHTPTHTHTQTHTHTFTHTHRHTHTHTQTHTDTYTHTHTHRHTHTDIHTQTHTHTELKVIYKVFVSL